MHGRHLRVALTRGQRGAIFTVPSQREVEGIGERVMHGIRDKRGREGDSDHANRVGNTLNRAYDALHALCVPVAGS
jgi:hypothetical protein